MTHDPLDGLQPEDTWLPRLTLHQAGALDDPQLTPQLAVLKALTATPVNTIGGSSGS